MYTKNLRKIFCEISADFPAETSWKNYRGNLNIGAIGFKKTYVAKSGEKNSNVNKRAFSFQSKP